MAKAKEDMAPTSYRRVQVFVPVQTSSTYPNHAFNNVPRALGSDRLQVDRALPDSTSQRKRGLILTTRPSQDESG